MKKLLFFFFLIPCFSMAQLDQTPIVVNVNNNPSLQYKGVAVKQKATVISYAPIISTTKDFSITVVITYYVNNSGSYGVPVIQDILSDGTLSSDQQQFLLLRYADQSVTYTTIGQCVDNDVSGNIVPCSTPSSVPEIQYWQKFKLNQLAGIGTLSTQGAADVQYKIIQAIISKLDSRKKW